ncbi:Panacea domain-containing protein [Acinetobacter puyangensis]|uniref:Uncharacterized phage-associated protein n=1 Tax=Acinetobacter puyangensis TaxID=1096779 RepID=A0A240E7P1_9GAMM|nr:type II toxin-antitoxin system antitoxin SocA domain-containing protein [Acinetobacter puyangensis]SNX44263.1 Uncharacterized phage-associated protein [Acinetobacter puyangensis]
MNNDNVRFSALDIANFIVDYANNEMKYKNLTPIKLQKILYYVYVNCLTKHNYKLFDDSIEKWKFGPVVNRVYHSFKTYGTSHIDATVDNYKFTDRADGGFSFEIIPFNKRIIENSLVADEIKATINQYIDMAPFDLVEKTHKEIPWKKFESDILSGIKGLVYSDEELINYFGNK